jgi:hypothetical protein
MRHLIGILLAIVTAAAVFFAASWGYQRLLIIPGTVLPADGGSLIHDHHVVEGFGALLAAGLLVGIMIAVPWISPLASGLPGLAMLGLTGVYLLSVRHAVRLIPLKTHPYGAGFEAMLFDGVLAIAGLAMIIPLFVPSRWNRPTPVPARQPYQATGGGYGDLQATQTMQGDGGLLSDFMSTGPQPQIIQDAGPSEPPWPPADHS